ncbi:MAG TPA: hypothetical protein VGI70_12235, partial [Polyangiales bacterium]
SFLAHPRRALADGSLPACASIDKAQYVIFATSSAGDPINASVPGTYLDSKIVHSPDPRMAAATLMLGGQNYQAATPWTSLSQSVLDRTSFWHLSTGTPVHPKEPDVLKLMGSTYASEMLPSLIARQLASCLGTVQPQPIAIGATSPSEGLSYQGAALPIIPAQALKATLTSPSGALTELRPLRDQTLNELYDIYKTDATTAQRAYIDTLVKSQSEVRNIDQNLLDALSSITDNGIDSQILAAVTLIQMNLAPVLSINIPFGGDNHRDPSLAKESDQTISGVAAIGSLMQQLSAAGLSDKVSLVSLNVFGRTLGPGNENGRQHNPNHQVSIAIGKPFKSGVIGGVQPVAKDYGAMPIASATGKAAADGDVQPGDTLASFGKTLLQAFGVDSAAIDTGITSGKVISGALS